MVPAKQQIEIAKYCGWVFRTDDDGCDDSWHDPDGVPYCDGLIPDYLHDLNAMHEAEEKLPHLCYYTEMLTTVCGEEEDWYDGWSFSAMIVVANATASQRAEAFLKTIDKWKD